MAAAPRIPSWPGCSAPTTCSSVRCGATSCAARSSCPPQRAGLQVEPELADALLADVERRARGAAAAVDRAARAVAAPRRPRAAPGRLRAHRRRARRGGATGGARLRPPRRPSAACRAASCCVSPARARAASPFAGGVRARRARGRPRPVAASSRAGRQPPGHRQRRDGRGRPRGAAARVAAAARLARGGRRRPPAAPHLSAAARDWDARGRDPGELYRGARLASDARVGRHARAELNATERAFLDASRAAAERTRPQRRPALRSSRASSRCSWSPRRRRRRAAPARRRAQRGARRRGAAARRPGLSTTTLDRSLLLARQGVALEDTPDPQQPARRTAAQPGGRRRDPRGRRDDRERGGRPGRRLLAIGNNAGQILLFDARTRQRLRVLEPTGNASAINGSLSARTAALAALHASVPGTTAEFRPAGGR